MRLVKTNLPLRYFPVQALYFDWGTCHIIIESRGAQGTNVDLVKLLSAGHRTGFFSGALLCEKKHQRKANSHLQPLSALKASE